MATQLIPLAAPKREQPFIEAFNALSDQQALRLFQQMAYRFSWSHGHDKIHDGILTIAFDSAQDEGWRGDDLAARYLEDPTRFGSSYLKAPTVRLIEGGR